MYNQLVTFQNHRIILSHERSKAATMDIYPSQHLLTYIREGILKVTQGGTVAQFMPGEFVLFRKFTPATITKTWQGSQTKFSSIVFSFHEDLVNESLQRLKISPPTESKAPFRQVFGITSTPILDQFIQSLHLFFEQGIAMDDQLAKLKTMEALIGMIKADSELAYHLQHFSGRSKADLFAYMNVHYLENKKLAAFARGSGRSLTVFKKDFKALYGTTPAKWLKQKRLDHAYQLLTATQRKASDIYLECGFEDLAHFSKSFKKQFNINPSRVAPF